MIKVVLVAPGASSIGRILFSGGTDVGLLRERNEDSFLLFPEHRLAVVADGMGGHMSGDVASSLAITTIQDFFRETVGPDRTWPFPYDPELTEEENCMVVGVRLANQQVFNRARNSSNEVGMGTTLVAIMLSPDATQAVVGHVGDSRCYLIREGSINQLTTDHSLISEVAEIAPWLSEEEVRQLPSNVITRALGMAPDVVVDLLTTDTQPGDLFLLCSDGLNGMLTDPQILEAATSDDDLDTACGRLIERANAAGGTDNTTVTLIRLDPLTAPGDVALEDTLDPTRQSPEARVAIALSEVDDLHDDDRAPPSSGPPTEKLVPHVERSTLSGAAAGGAAAGGAAAGGAAAGESPDAPPSGEIADRDTEPGPLTETD